MKMITQEDGLAALVVPRKYYLAMAPLNSSGTNNTCERTVSIP